MSISDAASAEVLRLLASAPESHEHAIAVVGRHEDGATAIVAAVKINQHWTVEAEAIKPAGQPWAAQVGTVISW